MLLIAHPPKRPARSQGSTIDQDTDDDFAGSTDWHNAVRWRWSLGNAQTGYPGVHKTGKRQPIAALALACQKSSYGERPDQTLFLAPASKGKVGWKAIPALDAAERHIRSRRDWTVEKEGAATKSDATNATDAPQEDFSPDDIPWD